MSERQLVITIDGPSGVGKSTISRRVAAALGFTYLDTGAMYRAVALHVQRKGVDCSDEDSIKWALSDLDIELLPASKQRDDVGVRLNGEDVSDLIRTQEMSMLASRVSAVAAVRDKLTDMQRQLGRKGGIVAEGRDTGTVVFPRARCKFFLTATAEERAQRRVLQLRERGEDVDEKRLLEMIITRDKNDSERQVAPLKKAVDATVIDTSAADVDQVLEMILAVVAVRS